MDFDKLVEEIVKRVTEKITQAEEISKPQSAVSDVIKPKLLILTEEHGDICHQTLENEKLLEYYQTECAMLKNYECDIDDYEAIIIFGLCNNSLSKVASGNSDTLFTELIQKAILCGKRLFLVKDTVELYKYEHTAPKMYYNMMLDKLEFLKSCGVVVCQYANLSEIILSGEAEQPSQIIENQPKTDMGKQVFIQKRVVTERDISEAVTRDVSCVRVGKRAIITELAKEYLQTRHITLLREE